MKATKAARWAGGRLLHRFGRHFSGTDAGEDVGPVGVVADDGGVGGVGFEVELRGGFFAAVAAVAVGGEEGLCRGLKRAGEGRVGGWRGVQRRGRGGGQKKSVEREYAPAHTLLQGAYHTSGGAFGKWQNAGGELLLLVAGGAGGGGRRLAFRGRETTRRNRTWSRIWTRTSIRSWIPRSRWTWNLRRRRTWHSR